MPDNPKPYTVGPEEKETLLLVYTPNFFARGVVVTRQILRVSTWMRTQAAPDYIRLYNAQLLFMNSTPLQSIAMTECYIPAPQVIAYHIAPPNSEPPDYDPTEPNRKMEPITAQLNMFRFNGHLRLSGQNYLGKFMETAREMFFSLYDVEITNPLIPNMGTMKVPYVALRTNSIIFSTRIR